jgi:hypothetical protein
MDPKRRNLIRQSIIETIKRFDPLDAVILLEVFNLSVRDQSGLIVDQSGLINIEELGGALGLPVDEIEFSIQNLKNLKCLGQSNLKSGQKGRNVTTDICIELLGREVIRSTSL